MKINHLIPVLFLGTAAILSAATSRIKDLATTATSAASDDYVALDGTTNNTRKMLASGMLLLPNSAMGALAVNTSGLVVNTKTLTGTTATLTFSATPTAGTIFRLTLTGHTSDCTVTIPSSYSLLQGATITTFVMPANAVAELSWRYDGTTYYLAGEPGKLLFTNPAAQTTVTFASGGTFITTGAFSLTLTSTGTGVLTMPAATDTLVGKATTDTFTNKTFDAAGTGNVLKAKGYIYLTHPHLADGTGATISTTATSIAYGHATFSHSVDQASNYVEYYIQIPEDIDTSVALRARLKVLLGGADTGTQRYVLSTVSVADSAVPTSSTLANAINVDFGGDGSGANGDVQTSAWTTLTSWAGALTAGQTWRIRLARDGDTSDSSTVNSTELGLVIEYGITQ
jgi:hypothetical protein